MPSWAAGWPSPGAASSHCCRSNKHAGEETVGARGATRRRKGGAGVGVGPGEAAVSGLVDLVGAVGQTSVHLVHAGNIKGAVRVAGDLDITDERAGGGQLSLVTPGQSIVGAGADSQATSIGEVVPGDVHVSIERAAGEVIGVARLTVIGAAGMDAKVRPAIGIRGSGGLIPAEALTTAADVEPDGKEGAAGTVIKNHWIAESILKGALTIGLGEAGEGSTAIGRDGRRGDVDRTGSDISRVVVGDDDLFGSSGLAETNVSDWVMCVPASVCGLIRSTSVPPSSGARSSSANDIGAPSASGEPPIAWPQ